MSNQWKAEYDNDIPWFSKSAYPGVADDIAAQRLKDDLPIVAKEMHGSSGDAYSYLRQVSMIDAFLAARESFSEAGWDALRRSALTLRRRTPTPQSRSRR